MKKNTLKRMALRSLQIGGGLIAGSFMGDLIILAMARNTSKISKLVSFSGGMLTSLIIGRQIDNFVNAKIANLEEQEEQEDSEVEETVTEDEFEDYLASIDNR